MSALCEKCLPIFQAGLSPLALGQLHLLRRDCLETQLLLPFNSEKKPHHPSIQSLQRSVREGCYIGVVLAKFLGKNGVFGRQSLEHSTTFEYHCKANIAGCHPYPFEVWVRHNGGYGVTLGAFPASGLTNSAELDGLPASTGSQASHMQALQWFRGCTRFHAKCRTAANSSSWFPTRLVDLGSGTSVPLRLIETSQTPPSGRYATLSYCWGSAVTVKLTRDTLKAYLERLPESELPKTFRDAFKVATNLGIRYLWIDSLCIIQDSVQDWKAESSVMGRVYQNGLCNIAATASKDSHGGLSYCRDPRTIRPAVTVSGWEDCPPSTYTVSDLCLWEHGVSKAALNSRGWVLQERFLAPRILHFGLDQLYWECFELQACEAFPRGLPQRINYKDEDLRMKELDFAHPSKSLRPRWQEPPLPQFDGHRVWKAIVEIYSRRSLTYPKDKLVAISAVAKKARHALKDDYLAGLWRRHLGWELLWEVSETGSHTRPSIYRCPSWSWASVDGEVHLTDYGPDELLLLNILEAEITPLGEDDTAEISDGFVRLQGRLYPMLLVMKPPERRIGYGDEFDVSLIDRTTGRETLRKVRAMPRLDVDTPLDEDAEEGYFALLHHTSKAATLWARETGDNYYILALLLTHDAERKTYRRRGRIQLTGLEDESGNFRKTRRSQQGDLQPGASGTGPRIQADDSARGGDGSSDDDSSDVDPSATSQLDGNRFQCLEDLELAPYYDPKIPCEAYSELSGYTITIV